MYAIGWSVALHPPLAEGLAEAIHRHGPPLLCTDFDGTLAPFRRNPAAVTLRPVLWRLLRQLAALGSPLAVLSGRTLPELRQRFGHDHWLTLIGEHGATASGLVSWEMGPPQGLPDLAARLERLLPDILLERKRTCLALHLAPAETARLAAVQEAVRDAGWHLRPGRRLLELFPPSATDKGQALQRWLQHVPRATQQPVIYLGDDWGDEPALRHLASLEGGFPIAVRVPRPPYAFVPAHQVGRFLSCCLAASAARFSAPRV